MMDGDMMGGGMMGAMGIWAFLAILALIAVLVVAVLASIWLVRKLREDGNSSSPPGGGESAHDTLRRRYASGEINDDEYERRLAALNRP
jgi:putative membrane protein